MRRRSPLLYSRRKNFFHPERRKFNHCFSFAKIPLKIPNCIPENLFFRFPCSLQVAHFKRKCPLMRNTHQRIQSKTIPHILQSKPFTPGMHQKTIKQNTAGFGHTSRTIPQSFKKRFPPLLVNTLPV